MERQSPPANWIKVNTDATIGIDESIGIGAALRDEEGSIVAVLMANIQGISCVFYGK